MKSMYTEQVLRGMAEDELNKRLKQEREKALEKYGETALLPGGHPDYDIHDYLINELVGLIRYSEMLRERNKLFFNFIPHYSPSVRKATIRLADDLEEMGRDAALRLISIRIRILEQGIYLGSPERR